MTTKAATRYEHFPTEGEGEVIPVVCCPECGTELEYYSGPGTMPEYLYCPVCTEDGTNPVAYHPTSGVPIGRII